MTQKCSYCKVFDTCKRNKANATDRCKIFECDDEKYAKLCKEREESIREWKNSTAYRMLKRIADPNSLILKTLEDNEKGDK